jgi:hypothetical protein
MSRSALAHLNGETDFGEDPPRDGISCTPLFLSIDGYLVSQVMCLNPKGIPAERRDFLLGKGYSAGGDLAWYPPLLSYFKCSTNERSCRPHQNQ